MMSNNWTVNRWLYKLHSIGWLKLVVWLKDFGKMKICVITIVSETISPFTGEFIRKMTNTKKPNPFWGDSMTEEKKLKQKQIKDGKQSWRDKKKRDT